MANEEQLAILENGYTAWNIWREKNPDIEIDLSHANLTEFNLSNANLSNANLEEADLSGVDIIDTNLSTSNLIRANLGGAVLGGANLNNASLYLADIHRANLFQASLVSADLTDVNLNGADLRGANFEQANLQGTKLEDANLRRANLKNAQLRGANLSRSRLIECDFSGARVGLTIFGFLDLREAKGLENIFHGNPSTISTDTFILSQGKIPDVFLKGCGLGDWEVEEVKLYNPDLSNEEINSIQHRMYDLRATQALQISPLFISYSHGDGAFVDKLEKKLNTKGVRFWRDIHDLKAGRIETQIDRAIRQNPTVLLVLSEHSLGSDWVELEVRTARGLEQERGRDVLCPLALDDSWKSSRWPKRVMEQIMEYNILDFSAWQDDVKFDSMFRKLIDGLELFYKR